MKRPLILSFIFFLTISISKAQQNPIPSKYTNPIPPSPNVASLGKFGDVPVGKYTGIPEISVPLLDLAIKDFNFQISASYHAAGVLVSEEASFLGLGWALNCGGVITQVVNDVSDFDAFGYINLVQPDPVNSGLTISGLEHYQTEGYHVNANCNGEMDYQSTVVLKTEFGNPLFPIDCEEAGEANDYFLNPIYDTDPDIFYFNFLNYSGKFLWDKENAKFEILDRQNIDIEFLGYELGWTLITPDGVKFDFSVVEKTRTYSYTPLVQGEPSTNSQTGPDFNTYYLNKITLLSGEEITLQYFEGDRICNLSNKSLQYISPPETSSENTGCTGGNSVFISQSTHIPQYIERILFPGGKFEFLWQTRLDLPNAKRLSGITEYRNNVSIRNVTFDNNHYFQGHSSWSSMTQAAEFFPYCPSETYSDDRLLKRLKLEGIELSNIGRPYRFEYNESNSLPSKLSYAQDYWGYYNGNDQASTLFPDPFLHYENTNADLFSYVSGSIEYQDRSPNGFAKTWVIDKITYPTGGYNQFQFENNTYGNFLNDNYSRDIGSTSASIFYSNHTTNTSNEMNSFTLDKAQNVQIKVRIPANSSLNTDSYNQNAYARVYDDSSNELLWEFRYLLDGSPPSPQTSCGSPERIYSISLPVGDYRISIEKDNDNHVCDLVNGTWYSVEVIYLEPPANPSVKFLTGPGLRVSKLSRSDGSGNLQEKNYSYEYSINENGNDVRYSHGIVMNLPLFYRKYYKAGSCSFSSCWACEGIEVNGSAFNSISKSARGSYVGYSKVTEIFGTQDVTNGRIESTYANQSDICIWGNIGPCVSSLMNGVLLKESIFDNAGQVLKMDSLTYQSHQNMFKTFGIKPQVVSTPPPTGDLDVRVYHLNFYPIHGYRTDLKNKTTFQYQGGYRHEVFKEFEYYPNGLLMSETSTGSQDEVVQNSFYYPQNFGTEPYLSMVSELNLINPVVENVTTRITPQNREVYRQLNNYTEYPDGDILLQSIENSFGATSKEIFRVLEYDNWNNPVEIVDRSGVVKSYQYNPTGIYPVAEVVNCSASQVFLEGFEDDGNSADGDAKTGRKSRTGGFSFPVYTILRPGEYALTYWQKNNGVWEFFKSDFIIGPSTSLNLSGQIDEVRIYPKDALVTTFTFNPGIGMTSKTDTNNVTTYFEYDERNRLKLIKDDARDVIKKFEYNYKN